MSNLEECIEQVVSLFSDLTSICISSSYIEKQKIQFLLFPEGIRYNRENDGCRTFKLNTMFAQIALQKQVLEHKKSGIPQINMDYSALVPGAGVEPARSPTSV